MISFQLIHAVKQVIYEFFLFLFIFKNKKKKLLGKRICNQLKQEKTHTQKKKLIKSIFY